MGSKKTASNSEKLNRSNSTHGEQLRRAINWCFNDSLFDKVRLHGNTSWAPRHLVALAVLVAWGERRRVTDSFEEAKKLSETLLGVVAVQTYQGMMRALAAYTDQLLPVVWQRIQLLMERVCPKHYRIGKWVPLAVDGSRFTTPQTESNEKAFAAKNYGSGKKAKSRSKWKNKRKRKKKLPAQVKPQIWLTLIWHIGSKLPWSWKTGPSTSSERHDMIDMIQSQKFPEKTLFCCDAGFTGYELWSSILDAGHHFLVRVGGNINLLKNLGHCRSDDDVAFLWPVREARRKQPPIVLRLIRVKTKLGTMYLVTSVLNRRNLSDSMLKRMYSLRWGVELQFRALKQTFDLSKLRSRNSDFATAELNWSIVALTMVQLFALKEQRTPDVPPENSSVGAALRAIRYAIHYSSEVPGRHDSLTSQLASAVKDDYRRTRSKNARHVHPKAKPPAGKPKIKRATAQQQREYQLLATAAS